MLPWIDSSDNPDEVGAGTFDDVRSLVRWLVHNDVNVEEWGKGRTKMPMALYNEVESRVSPPPRGATMFNLLRRTALPPPTQTSQLKLVCDPVIEDLEEVVRCLRSVRLVVRRDGDTQHHLVCTSQRLNDSSSKRGQSRASVATEAKECQVLPQGRLPFPADATLQAAAKAAETPKDAVLKTFADVFGPSYAALPVAPVPATLVVKVEEVSASRQRSRPARQPPARRPPAEPCAAHWRPMPLSGRWSPTPYPRLPPCAPRSSKRAPTTPTSPPRCPSTRWPCS